MVVLEKGRVSCKRNCGRFESGIIDERRAGRNGRPCKRGGRLSRRRSDVEGGEVMDEWCWDGGGGGGRQS